MVYSGFTLTVQAEIAVTLLFERVIGFPLNVVQWGLGTRSGDGLPSNEFDADPIPPRAITR